MRKCGALYASGDRRKTQTVTFHTQAKYVLASGASRTTLHPPLTHRKATLPTVILMVALGILASSCNRGRAATATPTPEVEVGTVEQRDVPVYSEWVATLDGYVNAEIRPQVSGSIINQNYTEGSLVRKGQVLFEIDPRPFAAALDRAKGDLAQAQAQLGKSSLDVERDTPLAEARAIAKSQLDNEVQAKLGAQAAVESAT